MALPFPDTIARFYASPYQQPFLLAMPTLVWLLLLQRVRACRRSPLWAYCTLVAAGSALDAWLTASPIVPIFGFAPTFTGWAAQAVPLAFVVLGDYRVYWLLANTSGSGSGAPIAQIDAPRRWLFPALLSLFPLVASTPLLKTVFAGQELRVTFLTYEVLFLAFFATVNLGRLRDRRVLYVLSYYSAWILADVWLLSTPPEGAPAAWALRIVANVLYYVGWSPWVFWSARRP